MKTRLPVAIGKPEDIAPDTIVHRVGGASLANLRLSRLDRKEDATDLQALHKVDELDAVIDALGLHLRWVDGSQELPIRDVQIWSDGAMSCRLLDSTLQEVNGMLLGRPGQPVSEQQKQHPSENIPS
jgi:hypothetical protein